MWPVFADAGTMRSSAANTSMDSEPNAHPNRELHELVASLRADNEAMLARENAVVRAAMELERLTQAKLRVIEELRTAMTGIRSDGREDCC